MTAPNARKCPASWLSLLLLLASTMPLTGCAHTKPLGQTLVALGGLLVGLGALDAAGVLGSDCASVTTPQGDTVETCSGSSVAPQPVNIAGIAVGAALIGGGAWLWTSDKQSAPPQQAHANSFPLEKKATLTP